MGFFYDKKALQIAALFQKTNINQISKLNFW
jgi:hypothetical protein